MEYLDGRLTKTTDNLAAKSILGRFGYSTNKRSEQCHSIIDFVLEYKYASKAELVNLLSWLIRFNGARAHEVKSVWERDIMYVNQKNNFIFVMHNYGKNRPFCSFFIKVIFLMVC